MNDEIKRTDLISVIVPVYKTEKYLSKCIDSILQQTYQNYEIILVDDGSPDHCGVICDQYAELDKRVRVIHKQNGGLSDARNAGIQKSRGEYITFVDSDDWIEPNYLEVLYSGIQLGAQICVCGFFTVRNGVSKPWRNPSSEIYLMTALDAIKDMMYARTMDTSACVKLFHKNCFEQIEFPVGCLYEEVATTYRLFYTQQKIAVTTQPLYYYVKHSGSIVTSVYRHQQMDMMRFSEEMLSFAEEQEESLIPAAKRRIVYAACFLLKTMGNHYSDFPEDVKEIRSKFLLYKKDVFRDPEVSRRDKAAIILLSIGNGLYVKAWAIYSKLTGRNGNA